MPPPLTPAPSTPPDAHPAGAPAIRRPRERIIEESFEGPLPHPAILAEYENIVPGLAERIVVMAENQSAHRQRLESRVVYHDTRRSMLGLIFALVIVLAGFGCAVYLALNGQPVAAGIFTLGPLATIAGIFIYQKNNSNSADKKKEE